MRINDNIDKYNPKSSYYNDVCYKTTSEGETDISLKNRRNDFVEKIYDFMWRKLWYN